MTKTLLIAAPSWQSVADLLARHGSPSSAIREELSALGMYLVARGPHDVLDLATGAGPGIRVFADRPLGPIRLIHARPRERRVDPSVWLESYIEAAPHRGEGVGLAVLGGGVKGLSVFGDRIDRSLSDSDGHDQHTTQVTEVAAADGAWSGPASKATIYSIVVATVSEAATAVNRLLLRNAHLDAPIRVLYVPTEYQPTTSPGDDPFGVLVEKAFAAGIVTCAPGGNEGPVPSPAHLARTITVGSCYLNSQGNPKDDLWVEGSSRSALLCKPNILCSWGAYALSKEAWGAKKALIGGTSPASGLAAGQITTWFGANPRLTPAGVIEILAASSFRPTNDPMPNQGAPWFGSTFFAGALDLAIAWSPPS